MNTIMREFIKVATITYIRLVIMFASVLILISLLGGLLSYYFNDTISLVIAILLVMPISRPIINNYWQRDLDHLDQTPLFDNNTSTPITFSPPSRNSLNNTLKYSFFYLLIALLIPLALIAILFSPGLSDVIVEFIQKFFSLPNNVQLPSSVFDIFVGGVLGIASIVGFGYFIYCIYRLFGDPKSDEDEREQILTSSDVIQKELEDKIQELESEFNASKANFIKLDAESEVWRNLEKNNRTEFNKLRDHVLLKIGLQNEDSSLKIELDEVKSDLSKSLEKLNKMKELHTGWFISKKQRFNKISRDFEADCKKIRQQINNISDDLETVSDFLSKMDEIFREGIY